MKLKIGDAIVWAGDLESIESLREGTVTKLSKDLVWVNGQHKPEDCIYNEKGASRLHGRGLPAAQQSLTGRGLKFGV